MTDWGAQPHKATTNARHPSNGLLGMHAYDYAAHWRAMQDILSMPNIDIAGVLAIPT